MTVSLTPHSEELLKRQLAAGQFGSPEEVIERALEALSAGREAGDAMSLAEFEAMLDALGENSDRLPVLSAEATTRAGIYRDHK